MHGNYGQIGTRAFRVLPATGRSELAPCARPLAELTHGETKRKPMTKIIIEAVIITAVLALAAGESISESDRLIAEQAELVAHSTR